MANYWELCYEADLNYAENEAFDVNTTKMLSNMAGCTAVPIGFLVPPLLTATSHMLNGAKLKTWCQWTQPSIIYSCAIGFVGTNKSAALRLISAAIRAVEAAKGIDSKKSRINQCK